MYINIKLLACGLFLFSTLTIAQTTTNLLPNNNGDDDISSWQRIHNAKIGSPQGAYSKAFKFELLEYIRAPWWEIKVAVSANPANDNSIVFNARAYQKPNTEIGVCKNLVSVIDFFDDTSELLDTHINYFDISNNDDWENINSESYALPINTTSISLSILPNAAEDTNCSRVYAYFDQVELLLTESEAVCSVDTHMCHQIADAAELEAVAQCFEDCSSDPKPYYCPATYLTAPSDLLEYCEDYIESGSTYDDAYNQCVIDSCQ